MFFSSKVISFRNGPKRAILNLKACFEDKKAVLLPANFLQTFGGKVWGVNDLLAQTSASCMILKQVYWKAHFKARRPPHLLGCLTILKSEGIFVVLAFDLWVAKHVDTYWNERKQNRFHLQEMSLPTIYWIHIVTKLAIRKSQRKKCYCQSNNCILSL